LTWISRSSTGQDDAKEVLDGVVWALEFRENVAIAKNKMIGRMVQQHFIRLPPGGLFLSADLNLLLAELCLLICEAL
jgi:hypothetical protein